MGRRRVCVNIVFGVMFRWKNAQTNICYTQRMIINNQVYLNQQVKLTCTNKLITSFLHLVLNYKNHDFKMVWFFTKLKYKIRYAYILIL